jgi:hypothetical protein
MAAKKKSKTMLLEGDINERFPSHQQRLRGLHQPSTKGFRISLIQLCNMMMFMSANDEYTVLRSTWFCMLAKLYY